MSNETSMIHKYDTYLKKAVAMVSFEDVGETKFLGFKRKVKVDIYLEYQVDENRFYIVKCENGKEVKRTLTKTNIENSLAILLGIKNRIIGTQDKVIKLSTDKVTPDTFETIRSIHDNRDRKIKESEIEAFLL